MRIRVGNWKIDISSLIYIQWRFPFPKVYLHEKFNNTAKWITRGLTLVGIMVSIISLPPEISFAVALALAGLDLLIEKLVFTYSVIIVQPPPGFEFDTSQWVTNGYLFPNPEYKEQYGLINHFGPTYRDRDYAIQFFEYLMSWNQGSNDDPDNNICVSFVRELDESYSTYIYANPDRKWLDEAFLAEKEKLAYDKKGKIQQSMVMQMIYWKNIKIIDGTLWGHFINDQPENAPFFLAPFYMVDDRPECIEQLKIKKYTYTLKLRNELTTSDAEYYHR